MGNFFLNAQEARKYLASANLPEEFNNAAHCCYMTGVNRDGHVWVTWSDVEMMLARIAKLMEDEE